MGRFSSWHGSSTWASTPLAGTSGVRAWWNSSGIHRAGRLMPAGPGVRPAAVLPGGDAQQPLTADVVAPVEVGSLPATLEKVQLTLPPKAMTAPMMATAMRATRRPYSTAAAPRSAPLRSPAIRAWIHETNCVNSVTFLSLSSQLRSQHELKFRWLLVLQ